MQNPRQILVVIDPDKKHQAALDKALVFAADKQVSIKLLSCLYYPSVMANNLLNPKQLEQTKTAIIKMHQGRLQKLITKHNNSKITFTTEVIWHSPVYQGILQVMKQFNPDLLIKATHPHKTISRRLFTPTDWYLLKACPVPVLLVKDKPWNQDASVLACIDPEHNLSIQSELDKNVLGLGHLFSLQLKMPLHAVHCFDPSYWEMLVEAIDKSGMWADVFSVEPHQSESQALDKMRQQHNNKFIAECAECVPNVANQHMLSGDIEQVIGDTVDKLNTAILVLGTTYRTGLLGSTAQRLIESVDSDLLAVKPKDFEPPFH